MSQVYHRLALRQSAVNRAVMLHFGHMVILFLALIVSFALEAYCLYYTWHFRRILLPAAATCGVFTVAGMGFWRFDVWAFLLAIVALYRFFHQAVAADGRSQPLYLLERAKRIWWLYMGIQLFLAVAWWRFTAVTFDMVFDVAGIIGAVTVCVAGVVAVVSVWHWRRAATLPALTESHPRTKDLPTVTIAIPARNETEVLERCLRAAIASDYPKLEILVLDDCSQDATADIIKSFAHDGVRFVQGKPAPNNHWVHKNYASHQLLEHAAGGKVLSMGVDVVLQPHTVRTMVAFMQSENAAMVAAMPQRLEVKGNVWLQTIRYWWEVALPRGFLRRPPVLCNYYCPAGEECRWCRSCPSCFLRGCNRARARRG